MARPGRRNFMMSTVLTTGASSFLSGKIKGDVVTMRVVEPFPAHPEIH